MTPEIAARLRGASGFVFDMDGTIALGDAASGGHKPLPHAIALLELLERKSIPFVVFTNGSAKSPKTYAASLRSAGFPVPDERMLTPSASAARWYVKEGIGKVRVLGNEGTGAPLRDLGIEVVGPSEKASGVEAVFTGWHRDFVFADLEAACDSLWQGARFTTASHVPFFAAEGGRAIGASYAINAMLTSLTGKRPRILGKPGKAAIDTALATMNLPRSAVKSLVVVGDDPALEMRLANSAGALAIGVSTGMMKDVDGLPPRDRPAALLSSLEPLLEALSA